MLVCLEIALCIAPGNIECQDFLKRITHVDVSCETLKRLMLFNAAHASNTLRHYTECIKVDSSGRRQCIVQLCLAADLIVSELAMRTYPRFGLIIAR